MQPRTQRLNIDTLTFGYSAFGRIYLVDYHLKLTRSRAGEYFKLFRNPLLLLLDSQASFHLFRRVGVFSTCEPRPCYRNGASFLGGAEHKMASGCCSNRCITFLVVASIAVPFMVAGLHCWMEEKSYVFNGEEIALITTRALEKTKGDHILQWWEGGGCKSNLLWPVQASHPIPP